MNKVCPILAFSLLASLQQAHSSDDLVPPKHKKVAVTECRKYITNKAHDPSAIRFTNTPPIITSSKMEKELSIYEIRMEVRGKNGYNATRLSEVKCDLFIFEDNTAMVFNAEEIQ